MKTDENIIPSNKDYELIDEALDIKSRLSDWARRATKAFNQLSKDTNTRYYQQSPLNLIDTPVETMVVGINPGSDSSGISTLTPDSFLAGNPNWNRRFESKSGRMIVSKEWARFFGAIHFFCCMNYDFHPDEFDDDKKTVWTNVTPFATPNENLLKNKHYTEAIPFTCELIEILQPRQLVIVGSNIINLLASMGTVNKIPVVRDNQSKRIIEIGCFNSIPFIQLPHPSRDWGFNKFFIPSFISIWRNLISDNRTVDDIAGSIKHEITQWTDRINVME